MRLLAVVTLFAALAAGAGCKKKQPASSAAAPATAAEPAPAPSGGGNTNYQAGAGVAQNVRQAARRTVALNDMNTLGQIIAGWDTDNGRMPTKNDILAALKQYPNVLALVNDGAVILTGSTNRGGCWAYETEADTKGGIVLVGGRAARMSADEAKAAIRQ